MIKNILLVVAGKGLGLDEAACVQEAVAQALPGAEGEPHIFAVTMDVPLDSEEDFLRAMRLTRDAVNEALT